MEAIEGPSGVARRMDPDRHVGTGMGGGRDHRIRRRLRLTAAWAASSAAFSPPRESCGLGSKAGRGPRVRRSFACSLLRLELGDRRCGSRRDRRFCCAERRGLPLRIRVPRATRLARHCLSRSAGSRDCTACSKWEGLRLRSAVSCAREPSRLGVARVPCETLCAPAITSIVLGRRGSRLDANRGAT